VVPGGWFRILPTDDLIRLARIRVDIPVELDHLWKIDIRKAIAEPLSPCAAIRTMFSGEASTKLMPAVSVRFEWSHPDSG